MHPCLPPPTRSVAGQLGLLLLAVLPWLAAPAQAQQIDSTLAARFRLADAYFRAAQYDRAITILEDLYTASPETYAFYDKLKQAYENVKRYDEAITLVEAQLQLQPGPAQLSEKAALLYLKGDEAAAYRTWDDAVAYAPDSRTTYQVVYQSLYKLRLFERAIGVLEQSRQVLGEPTLFQTDLAYLYSLNGQYEASMQEYLGLLAANERQLGFVRSRLSRVIEQAGALSASISVVEQAVRLEPLNRSYRELLAWLYLEGEQYAKALDVNRAIDRLEQENGNVLFGFAQNAGGAGAYDVALQAYEEILDRYPDAPIAPEALVGRAEMHERWAYKIEERAFDERGNRVPAPHFEQALDAYRTFLQKYPNHPYFPEVLRRIGHLQQDVFFALGEAEATLEEVASRYPNTQAADLAQFDLGRIALQRGELNEARLLFSRLEEHLRIGELAEQARYELALLHFYAGEFEAALTLVEAMNENTSTDVANDAIELKVLLIENRGPDSLDTPLHRYAQARLLQAQRQQDEALEQLEALLADYGNHPLADDARYLRADLMRASGRTDDALAAFREFALLHPTSHLADRSLFMAARILEEDLGNDEAALAMYTRLLAEYPGSLLTHEVRTRIRQLRGDAS